MYTLICMLQEDGVISFGFSAVKHLMFLWNNRVQKQLGAS